MSVEPHALSALARWGRRFAIAVATLVALTLLAWLAIPPIARSQLEPRPTEGLGRKTTSQAVEFNPLALRITVRGLAVADPAREAPLLRFDELVTISPRRRCGTAHRCSTRSRSFGPLSRSRATARAATAFRT